MVALTTTPNKVCSRSDCVFHRRHGGTLFVSLQVDEYVEIISHNNNNHNKNNKNKNKNKNSDGVDATAKFIEINTVSDDLSYETSSSSFTTSSFATLNPTTKEDCE